MSMRYAAHMWMQDTFRTLTYLWVSHDSRMTSHTYTHTCHTWCLWDMWHTCDTRGFQNSHVPMSESSLSYEKVTSHIYTHTSYIMSMSHVAHMWHTWLWHPHVSYVWHDFCTREPHVIHDIYESCGTHVDANATCATHASHGSYIQKSPHTYKHICPTWWLWDMW